MATSFQPRDEVGADLVEAAIRVLAGKGPEALVLRRVAAEAGLSTMAVYSRFGDKAGLLDAVYRAGFERLEVAMSGLESDSDPLSRIVSLGLSYRRFALANPALYSLMFERTVGFDPPVELRAQALGSTFSLLVEAMSQAAEATFIQVESALLAAYTVWTSAHGAVSLELTHAARSPLPGWFIDSADAGELVFRGIIMNALRGMAPPDLTEHA